MISVIIPMYNSGEFLNRIIESLFRQTYYDMEILLIDDGSSDNTKQICQKVIEKDKRFKYFYQKNSGVSVARNNGIMYAKGEYIAFLDADDMIDDNYFEALMLICQNVDIAVCDVSIEDDTGVILSRFSLSDRILSSEEAINYLLKRQNINSGPCAKLFRSSIIKQIKFPELKVYEDILFVMKAFTNAQSIGVTDSTVYHYYQNTQSAMHIAVKNPPIDIVIATDTIMKFIIKHKNLESRCTYITLSHLYQYVQEIVKNRKENLEFLTATQQLFCKYWRQLLFCNAFPIKEKIIYVFFIFGWIYQKKFIRIR